MNSTLAREQPEWLEARHACLELVKCHVVIYHYRFDAFTTIRAIDGRRRIMRRSVRR